MPGLGGGGAAAVAVVGEENHVAPRPVILNLLHRFHERWLAGEAQGALSGAVSSSGSGNKPVHSGAEMHEEEMEAAVWAVTGFILLLTGLMLIAPRIHKLQYCSESAVAVCIGFLAGAVILFVFPLSTKHLQFSETLFFIAFLPPVIFAAGFSAPKRSLFTNMLPILGFGVIGTLFSTAVIAFGIHFLFPTLGMSNLRTSDCLLMGCIFSATDSVATLAILDRKRLPRLYAMVFGEGVLNDATSIVIVKALLQLRKTIDEGSKKMRENGSVTINVLQASDYWTLLVDFLWLFTASLITGVVLGLFSAYLMRRETITISKHGPHGRLTVAPARLERAPSNLSEVGGNTPPLDDTESHAKTEVAMLALLGYLSYLLAEAMELSGILAVFATGLVMSTYTTLHLTDQANSAARIVFSALSTVAEHSVLVYVGIDSLDTQKWAKLRPGEGAVLYFILLGLIAFARGIFVIGVTSLCNFATSSKIPWSEAIAVWWAGLVRGGVSIALAYHVFSNNLGKSYSKRNASIIAVTLAVVLTTTVVLGCLTKTVMTQLFQTEYLYTPVPFRPRSMSMEDFAAAAPVTPSCARTGPSWLERHWIGFERKYIFPYFGSIHAGPMSPKIAMTE